MPQSFDSALVRNVAGRIISCGQTFDAVVAEGHAAIKQLPNLAAFRDAVEEEVKAEQQRRKN